MERNGSEMGKRGENERRGYLYPRFGEDRQRDVYSWLPFLLRVGSAKRTHRRPQVLGEMGSHVQCICKFASLTVRRTLPLRCDFSSPVPRNIEPGRVCHHGPPRFVCS